MDICFDCKRIYQPTAEHCTMRYDEEAIVQGAIWACPTCGNEIVKTTSIINHPRRHELQRLDGMLEGRKYFRIDLG